MGSHDREKTQQLATMPEQTMSQQLKLQAQGNTQFLQHAAQDKSTVVDHRISRLPDTRKMPRGNRKNKEVTNAKEYKVASPRGHLESSSSSTSGTAPYGATNRECR